MDCISAPMLGHNIRVIAFHLSLRSSHLRNIRGDMHSAADKIVVMINPSLTPEPHSKNSFQYEFNFLDGKNCSEMHLVQRADLVSVKFQSMLNDNRDINAPVG